MAVGVFQFHKGAIRTESLMLRVATISYFNSIKVRLELNDATKKIINLTHFNSIKVRLELSTGTAAPFSILIISIP